MSVVAGVIGVSPDQLDYKDKIQSYTDYKNSRKPPQGEATISMSPTGNEQVVFQAPAGEVINFSKSRLKFRMYAPESGTGSRYTFLWTHTLAFLRELSLYGDNYYNLAQISNADVALAVIGPCDEKFSDYMTVDTPLPYATSALSVGSMSQGLAPSRTYGALDRPDNTDQYPYGTDIKYFIRGAVRDGAGAGDLWIDYDIPLSVFKNTILSQNKDYLFPQILNLRMILNGYTKLGWIGSSTSDPTAGAATYNPVSAPQMSNLRVEWAIEQNPQIKLNLEREISVTGGMNVTIPFIHSLKRAVGPATTQNVNYTINPAYGHHLKKIYHTLMVSDETLYSAYDHQSGKALVYWTSIDTIRKQDSPVDVAQNDDYMLMKEKLKGSVLQGLNMFGFNWVHVDQFGQQNSLSQDQDEYDRSIVSGMELHKDTRWEFQAQSTTNAAYQHYTFVVCLRNLNISKSRYSLDEVRPVG